ncbi:hypothetical protein [Sphingobacterium suaedae]|uniref:DUF4251 domain-containing protein n=1 Tax=Sphingobacterium suaedae TaxID=1686402 RepID=A0ABW5KMV0_9SPHI
MSVPHSILLFFIALSLHAGAQTDVNTLTSKIKQLEAQISEAQARTAVLKEALDLRSLGTEAAVDSMHMRVTHLYRDSTDNSLYIKGLVTYLGNQDQALQFATSDLIAATGGQYQAHSAGVVNDLNKTFHVPHAEKNIPYGFMLKFKEVNEHIPTASLITLRLIGNGLRGIEFTYKGLDVAW